MKSSNKTLYIVDGSSYMHRAFHAIRNLSNSQGLPTNAILGFTKMFMKLLNDKSPDYVTVAFDVKGPTFRHKIFKDYKANRPPMPEDLAVQIPYIKDVVAGLSVKILEKEGYEADDIIGTVALLASNQGLNVVIVSSDKDFRQTVSHNTVMWDSMSEKLTDYAAIKRDYGIEPEQIIEVMALSGDSADNIPGIPGVGKKTGLSLIQQFHSIENLFQNTDKITKSSLKKKLEEFKEQAFLSKKLVTITNSVPVDITLDDLRLGTPKKEKLLKIFRELEFKSLINKFSEHAELSKKDYRLILTKEELVPLIENIRKKEVFCFDTETTSTNHLEAELIGISFCIEPGIAYYLPLGHAYIDVGPQISLNEALDLLKGNRSQAIIALGLRFNTSP